MEGAIGPLVAAYSFCHLSRSKVAEMSSSKIMMFSHVFGVEGVGGCVSCQRRMSRILAKKLAEEKRREK